MIEKILPLSSVRRRKMVKARYFLRHAPSSIAASSLPGVMNYFIILYLVFSAGFEATGNYRIFYSLFSLVGLGSLIETDKIFIRSIIAGDRKAMTVLFFQRLGFAVATFLAVLMIYFVGAGLNIVIIPPPLVWIAAFVMIIYPLDLYRAVLQVRREFHRLFTRELVKYFAAFCGFIIMVRAGYGIEQAVMVQFSVIAFFHLIYFLSIACSFIDFDLVRRKFDTPINDRSARQARIYSFAGMLPASLEHVDKLLVGWVFGLEFLGIYALAFSTGRFVYNCIKPALYIYYRRFVDEMPGWVLLRNIASIFTILGITSAMIFLLAVASISGLDRFRAGSIVTVILFLSYGIAMVRATYGQAFALNKTSDAGHAWRASVWATCVSLLLLGLALISSPSIALVLLALQYPVRDGLSVALLAGYRRRAK